MKTIPVTAKLSIRGVETGTIPYIHKPLKDYFQTLNDVGYKIILFDEIYPSQETEVLYGESWRIPRFASFFCELN